MTTTDLRPSRPSGTPAAPPTPAPRGPLGRVVLGSLVFGAVAAAVLTLAVFPGAAEHVTVGVALLAFAAGWAMLAVLTTRMTNQPQRWAYAPAAFLAAAGLALVTFAPGDDGLTAAVWAWAPALLVVVVGAERRMRASMPGRTRWLLYPVLAALSLAAAGALVENVAVRRDSSSMTMPGELYDVDGHRLHLNCVGTGSPTVVLESGLGGSSARWGRITEGTATTTRVCSYDRAGQGWSDDAQGPQDSVAVTRDLHRLLEVAGEPGPYVLAGHSTGGVYAMTYAARYPEQVDGLVLLDSASPRQFTVLPAYAGQYAMMTRLHGVLPTLVRLGVGLAVPSLSASEVPGEAGKQATAFARSPRSARTARDELSTYRRSFEQAQALTTLGRKPLVVVSASETLADTAGWTVAQRQLAALSNNTDQRTVESSHEGVLDDPTAFHASVNAIADVVGAVRTPQRCGPSDDPPPRTPSRPLRRPPRHHHRRVASTFQELS
jgi:pimeloyl-ACP methyl ester carboxylesterase